MGRNYLWYRRDDAINAVLAAAGYDFHHPVAQAIVVRILDCPARLAQSFRPRIRLKFVSLHGRRRRSRSVPVHPRNQPRFEREEYPVQPVSCQRKIKDGSIHQIRTHRVLHLDEIIADAARARYHLR